MKISEFIKELNRFPQDYEIRMRRHDSDAVDESFEYLYTPDDKEVVVAHWGN